MEVTERLQVTVQNRTPISLKLPLCPVTFLFVCFVFSLKARLPPLKRETYTELGILLLPTTTRLP